MKIVDRKTAIHNMGESRTVKNFNELLGDKPHKLGLVATLYPELAITVLTDALKNVFYNSSKKGDNFTPINAMAVEWNIDVNYIHKVYIAVTSTATGANKGVVTLVLDQKYYAKNDTFTLENRQQLMVIAPPVMLGPKRWSHQCILVGNDLTKTIDINYTVKGKYTRYRSNYHPEFSERGYTKYLSNTETHRNYISRHRASEDVSADYLVRERVYLQQAKEGKFEYYKMHQHEKDCLDTFMVARNNSCLFSETNYDINGKCLDQDEKGRDVPMGDGIIPQIERYCDKFLYTQLSSAVLDDILLAMVEKSDKPTGNIYAAVVNERLWHQFGAIMKSDYRFNSPNDATFLYSKAKGGNIKTGATFDSYTIQGNTLVFLPDRALSQEYDNGGYGVFLDASADVKTGRPNLAMFTLEGNELVEGFVKGLGGRDGKTSGDASTGVHGSEYHLIGYSLAVLFNPYKSFVLKENTSV